MSGKAQSAKSCIIGHCGGGECTCNAIWIVLATKDDREIEFEMDPETAKKIAADLIAAADDLLARRRKMAS